MSEERKVPADVQRALNRLVTIWSDGDGYRQAGALAESHSHLLPKPVTHAQLHGLRNVVGAAPDPKTVKMFTDNQRDKAYRRGDLEMRDYWAEVGTALARLSESAQALWAEARSEEAGLSKNEAKAARAQLHMSLMRGFVQHLVAHSLYLKEQPEDYGAD